MTELVRRVKGFFVPGEKNAFGRIQELVSLGEEALQLLIKILSTPASGDGNGSRLKTIHDCTERINVLEKDGDKITQSLEEMLGRGSITASVDYDFGRLADNVDSILDRAHGLSRQLRRVAKHPLREAKDFDSAIRLELISLIEIGLTQLRLFTQLLSIAGTDRTRGIDLAREIEKLEEEGDDVKDAMLDEIYGSWEKLDFASFHNYLVVTTTADDILDLCEDASDLVIAIMKALGAYDSYMLATLDIVSLALAGLLGMVVGGNNLAACCGPIIGSGMISRRSGTLLAVAGYLAGLSLEGPKLFRVREIFLPVDTSTGTLAILIASLLVFLGGQVTRVPLSLSKALTGAILGVAIASGSLAGSGYLILILAFWFLVPIIATGLGVLLVAVDDRLSPRNLWLKLSLLKTGLLVVSFLSAYVLGSNTLGLIAGVVYSQTLFASIVVGVGSVLGAFLLGKGPLRRLSEGIFSLRYPNAFFSQLIGSATVELANQAGVPLSITETVSSGIIGSGLGRRVRVMNARNVFLIISSWILSPITGFILAYVLTKLI